MKSLIATLLAATVAISALGVTMPANAAQPGYGAQFQQVDNHNRSPRFTHQGKYYYLNGHRGDSHWHSGWRKYNGYYFPPAAFVGFAIGAAVLGGIIAHAR